MYSSNNNYYFLSYICMKFYIHNHLDIVGQIYQFLLLIHIRVKFFALLNSTAILMRVVSDFHSIKSI